MAETEVPPTREEMVDGAEPTAAQQEEAAANGSTVAEGGAVVGVCAVPGSYPHTTKELLAMDTSGDVYVPPRSWSGIWERFYCRKSAPGKAFCVLCPDLRGFVYKVGMQSTGTLGTHLMRLHQLHLTSPVPKKSSGATLKPEALKVGKKHSKQESLPTGQTVGAPTERSSGSKPSKLTFDARTVYRMCVAFVDSFVIRGLMPFHSVEEAHLRDFCSTIQPRYTVPTTKEVKVRTCSYIPGSCVYQSVSYEWPLSLQLSWRRRRLSKQDIPQF